MSAPTSDATPGANLAYREIADTIRDHARLRPTHPAIVDGSAFLDYAGLHALMDRVAASLQRDGVGEGEAIAICAASSARYAAIFLGALRAGVVVAPLAPSSTPASFASMLADANARLLFVDAAALDAMGGGVDHATAGPRKTAAGPGAAGDRPACISLDTIAPGPSFDSWLAPAGTQPREVTLAPQAPFNIIYSSGTTGTPKGIVQPHGMRWSHVARGGRYDYDASTVALLATPLYSNTTLVVFFPAVAFGGTVVLMAKFDAEGYLALAERHRATHTMLVPVQYQRIMASPRFGEHDLSSFKFKFCTSAPFPAELKADVVARWPGGLIEFYGMTEGGGTCILAAHEHPTKLHTVGPPSQGHDIRLIDEAGRELPPGSTGEVVGHSPGMMTGYHRQPEKTREAEWFDATGKRFIRTGDVGRFDEDGFLTLLDRRKDMIISGGFNIFPSDLEAVLRTHPDVADAAVAGVPSERWGETPAAWVVPRAGSAPDAEALRLWANERVGKTQRIAFLRLVDELPRSAIGKVLKRELRERFVADALGSAPRPNLPLLLSENHPMPHDDSKPTPLGASGLKVSKLWLGTMMFGDQTSEAEAGRMVGAARDAGLNALDTADVYAGGESERITGRLIAGDRERWVLATKLGNVTGPGPNERGLSRLHMVKALDASLARLGTDWVDILYLHREDESTPLEETVLAMKHLLESGKVHYFGVSNFRAWRVARLAEMCRAAGIQPPIVNQPPYNAMSRQIETELLPCCAHYGIGVVAYSPFARGVLSGKYTPGAPAPEGSRAARNDPRIMQTEFRAESLALAQRLVEHARKRGRTPVQLALGWVWNNALVHGVIGGPKTLAQWQEYVDAIGTPFDAEDEALVASLVATGHASTPNYTDPAYPIKGRQPRTG